MKTVDNQDFGSVNVFLDDTPEDRMAHPRYEGWGHVFHPNEMIELICANDIHVEKMSLDYDLGIDPITGRDVLCWIERQMAQNSDFLRGKLPKEIYIHSANIGATKEMEQTAEKIMEMAKKE